VVVFTKYDALLDRAANELGHTDNNSTNAATAEAKAEAIYEEQYYQQVMGTAHPPKTVVRLKNMQDPRMNCDILSEETARAIDNTALQQVFISVQQNNLDLCIYEAARSSKRHLEDSSARQVIYIWKLFPHYWTCWGITNVEMHKVMAHLGDS